MRNHKNPRVPKKRMVGNIDKQVEIDKIGGKLAVFGDNVGFFKLFTTILQ